MDNYFELYDIPACFAPDAAVVKKKYYELSRRYHPDRYTLATEAEQAEALRMAAINNDAYKTLQNADATMAYILRLHGLLEEEEKYNLPPDFLMEMMDLNEAVSDCEDAPDNTTLQQQAADMLAAQMQAWQDGAISFTKKYDDGDTSVSLLMQIKDSYFRKKYLLRISERINTFAAR
ncbi:hypothetical protein CAP35_12355 [Chitinophagaceae bacterium IBVUCB1]|nr:hypothetical protein CAP35_12355 [Chitinophagaceae bacterium IBVUCB1]